MKLTTGILAGLLAGLVVVWVVLRLTRPELAKEWSSILKGVSAAVGTALVFLLTFGHRPVVDPTADLETTAAKYETKDTFENLESGADNLEPAPPSANLDDELDSFRAGSDELLRDGDDPR